MYLYREFVPEVGRVSLFWVEEGSSGDAFISQPFPDRGEAINAAFVDSLEWMKVEFICELNMPEVG